MTIALLPLGLISVSHTVDLNEESAAWRVNALRSETLRYTAELRERLAEMRGIAATLGQVVQPLHRDTRACSAALAKFISERRDLVFAGYIDQDGRMDCASRGGGVDFSENAGFQDMKANPGPRALLSQTGRVSGQPVAIVSVPVPTVKGQAFAGTVSVSFQILEDNLTFEPILQTDSFSVRLVSGDGTPFQGSEAGQVDTILPEGMDLTDLVAKPETAFQAIGTDGRQHIFAVTSLPGASFSIIGRASVPRAGLPALVDGALYPVSMWLASIAVVLFGNHRLVLRHVRQLQSAMLQFGLGQRDGQGLRLDDAPEELEDAARAFNRMALVLRDAEAQAKRDLQDKETLLREVHHRVKNNLQFIMSIINFQLRRADTDEAREIVSGLQKRIRGLATMHRCLYESPQVTVIDAAALLRTMISDMGGITGAVDDKVWIEADLEPLSLDPDRGAPLAMLFAEALTNAIKHSGPDPSAPISVSLSHVEDGMARLAVTNPVEIVRAQAGAPGLGLQLMEGFVTQIRGHAEQHAMDGHFCYQVDFPVEAVPDQSAA